MAENQLVYVSGRTTVSASDLAASDLAFGETQFSSQSSLTLKPFSSTGIGLGVEDIPVNLFDWQNVQDGSWAVKRTINKKVVVTPLSSFTPEERAQYLTKGVRNYIDKNPNDPLASELGELLSEKSSEAPFIDPTSQAAMKSSTFKEFGWTAAPAPHWAYVIGEEQSEPGADGVSLLPPEMGRSEDYLRVGSVCFAQAVGPMDMHVSITPQLESSPAIRQSTEMKRIGGALRKTISFSLLFTNEASVRAELIPFLRQSRRAPFVPIIHSGLLHQHGITAIAVQSCSLSTVPEHPGCIQLNVVCYPFPEERYLLDGDIMDVCVNYPLLELWLSSDERYYQDLYGTAGIDAQTTQDQPYETPVWNGQLSLSTPSRDWLDLVNENVTPADQKLSQGQAASDSLSNAAVALSGSGTASDEAYALIPPSTQADAKDQPIVSIHDFFFHSTENIVNTPQYSGKWVAVQVTSNLAPFAFQPEKLKGPPILLQAPWTYSNDGKDLTGTPIDGVKRDVLLHGSGVVALSGQYLALWQVGVGHTLPKGKGGESVTLSDGIEVAAQKALLDPNNPQFTIPVGLEGFVIESVSAGQSNCLAEIAPGDASTPEYQIMGSSDVSAEFSGVCDVATLDQLYSILYEVSALAVDYRGTWDGTPYGGYCKIDNEIAQILGMKYAIPTRLSIDTIDNFPTHRRVTISFVNFNPMQRKIQSPSSYSNASKTQVGAVLADSDYLDRAGALQFMEMDMQKMELYPDIQPPSWFTLQTWCRDLKNGKVWDDGDIGSGRPPGPYPDYSFLTVWPYTSDWLDNHAAGFMQQSLPFDEGELAPDGYADPDFWCTGRGDPNQHSGRAFVEDIVTTLHTQQAETVYTSSDGVTTSVRQDTNGIVVGSDSKSSDVFQAHLDSAQAHEVLGVPFSARGSKSSVNVTDATHEDNLSAGVGTSLPSNMPVNSEDTFYKILGPKWKSGNRDTKAKAVLYFSKKIGIPLALAANLMLTESDDDDLVNDSSAGPHPQDKASSTGPVQETEKNFLGRFKEAMQKGLLPKGTIPDRKDVRQSTVAGLLEYKFNYDQGYGLMANKGLSDPERQYYSWIYATAAYNGGAYLTKKGFGTNVYYYLKHGGDPRLIAQNIRMSKVRDIYVPNVFGHGPRVKSGEITLQSFQGGSTNAVNNGNTGPDAQKVYEAARQKWRQERSDYLDIVDKEFPGGSLVNFHKSLAKMIAWDNAHPEPTPPPEQAPVAVPAPAPAKKPAPIPRGEDGSKIGPLDQFFGFGNSEGTFHTAFDDFFGTGDHKGSVPQSILATVGLDDVSQARLKVDIAKENAKEDAIKAEALGYEQIHQRDWSYERAAYDEEAGEDIFWSARRSDQTGRLLRAYPASCVLLIDGGKWIGFYHLTDLFYGLHSAMDITCYASRLTPADSCVISFADPYGTLSSQSADVELNKMSSTQRNIGINDFFKGAGILAGAAADILVRRSEELKSLLVKPGNRLHVRLGYGSNAADLPVCFNGVVSSVEKHADVLVVTGLGDGYELTSQLSPTKAGSSFYEKTGMAGSGMEVRDIILDILASGENETVARVLTGFFGATNPWGIEHFGDVIRNKWLVADCAEIGVNIYSGWGDSPVNVSVAAESGPLGLIAQAIDGGASFAKDQKNAVNDYNDPRSTGTDHSVNNYNDPKNKETYNSMSTNEFWRCVQGEELVGIRMENATPWQVFDALRLACLDYVMAVEHFGLRSTLFFGKDWWPFHFQYDYDYINTARALPPESAGKDALRVRAEIEAARLRTAAFTDHAHANAQISEAQGSAPEGEDPVAWALFKADPYANTGNTQNIEPIYRRRPFVQVHVCHSGTNLIASQIDATAEGWYRAVQATGSYAGTLESDQVETSLVQYIDSDIYPQFQNVKLVQSGLYSTESMRLAEIGGANLLNISQAVMSTNVLNNYAVGALHDEVRKMYEGNVYQTGNGYLRPRHLVHLIDSMRQMSGPLEVKEVTHTFGMGGFITTWTPDCVATAMDTQKFPLITHALQFGARYYAIKGILAAARSEVGSRCLRSAVRRTLSGLAKLDEVVADSGGAGLRYVAHDLKRLGGALLDRTPISRAMKSPNGVRGIKNFRVERKDVLDAAEKEFGGWDRLLRRKRFSLRVTKNAILNEDKEELLIGIERRIYGAKKNANASLNSAERKRVTAYVNKVLYEQKKFFGVGDPVLKGIENTPEARAALNNPSLLRKPFPKLSKVGDLFREATNRITNTQIKVSTLKYLQETIGDSNPVIRDAFTRSIGKLGDSDTVSPAFVQEQFRQTVEQLEKKLVKDKALLELRKASTRNTSAARKALIARLEKDIASKESTIKAAHVTMDGFKAIGKTARGISSAAKSTVFLAKLGLKSGKLAKFVGVGKAAVKIVGGPWELLFQVVLGSAVTQLNRYLASRQALKIFPLQSCHKEWTAGITGHLGSVAGDPLGPASSIIQHILGSGAGSAQQNLIQSVIGSSAGSSSENGDSVGLNVVATVLGINDPHYNTNDGTYHELMAAYGFPRPQEESPTDAVIRAKKDLARLASMNDIGLKASSVVAGTGTPGTIPGEDGQVIPVVPGDTYLSRAGTITGQRYARVVRDLALYITNRSQQGKPAADNAVAMDGGTDMTPGKCQGRMVRVMNAEGLDSTSYYPHSETAWESGQALLHPPFSKYWQLVANKGAKTASIPNGSLCFWKQGGNGSGHVAILYRYENRTFLVGNTDGNTALEITNSRGLYSSVDLAFLPK